MLTTGLLGPHRLSFDGICAAVPRQSPGVYVLGHGDLNGRFCVNHVGRADADVAASLRNLIGSDSLFKFGVMPSPRDAFERECVLFHTFRPPGNRLHPSRSAGTNWTCPRCRFLTEF